MVILKLLVILIFTAFIISSYQVSASDDSASKKDQKTTFGPSGFLADEWKLMSESEALNYYTAYELCAIRNDDSCQSLHLPENSFTTNDFYKSCLLHNYGAFGSGVNCGFPYGALFRHKSISPQSWAILDIVYKLLEESRNTIVFFGDSVTRQQLADATCVIRRFGFEVEDYGGSWDNLEHRSIKFPVDINSDSIKQFSSRFGSHIAEDQPFFHIYFYIVEAGQLNPKVQLDAIIGNSNTHGKLTVVVNMGLHYHAHLHEHAVENYETDMLVLLENMKEYVMNGHIFLFRETSAQHFATIDGSYKGRFLPEFRNDSVRIVKKAKYFPSQYHYLADQLFYIPDAENHRFSFDCVPLSSEKAWKSQNWKNEVIEKVITNFNKDLKETISKSPTKIYPVELIRWFNATAGRPDYHSSHQDDCTHYCHGPMIFAPLWESFGRILESLLK